MKQTRILRLLVAVLGLLSSGASQAHTSYPDTVTCPIDGEKFVVYVTMSYSTFSTLADFQSQGAIGDLYESYVNSCPKCHYSGYQSDLDTTFSDAVKQDILTILTPYKNTVMTDVAENEVAVKIHQYFKRNNDDIANLYLVASYYIKHDTAQTAKRKELQLAAISYFKKAIADKEYKDIEEYASINYLIGELYRRTGAFEDAIRYFDLALNDNHQKDWLPALAKKQKRLAVRKDDDNTI